MNNPSFPNLTPEQQSALLRAAGEKLHMDPADLESALKSGKFSRFIRPGDPAVERFLNDPKAREALLSDPKAQAVIRKLMGR